MEQIFYWIIIGALFGEYFLSTISAILNMKNITELVPNGFQDYYDEEKYAKSQAYLKDNTRFGLFTGTFSLAIIFIVIHLKLFGELDQFVRSQANNQILVGLLFFGIIYPSIL